MLTVTSGLKIYVYTRPADIARPTGSLGTFRLVTTRRRASDRRALPCERRCGTSFERAAVGG